VEINLICYIDMLQITSRHLMLFVASDLKLF